jgi:hypothetical protein
MSFLPGPGDLMRAVKESSVWRSLFRQPYPDTSRTRALAVMNNVFLHLHPVRVKRHAVRYTYTFCLGGISFFLFLALTVTGVYLMFFYVPSVTRAYQDIGLLPCHDAASHIVIERKHGDCRLADRKDRRHGDRRQQSLEALSGGGQLS